MMGNQKVEIGRVKQLIHCYIGTLEYGRFEMVDGKYEIGKNETIDTLEYD
jgi:hypothetical protein